MKVSILCGFILSCFACVNALTHELNFELFDCEASGYLQQAESCGWPSVDDPADLSSSQSFSNYQNWCKAANLHNQDPTSTYTRKLTCYANINRFQRSTIQFGVVKLNLTRPVRSAAASCRYPTTTPISSLPKTVDWRSITKPVRDQGECGSCWAHSTIGLCEAYHRKVKKIDVALSIQTLVTCDETNLGCDGGNVDVAGDFIYSNNIDTEDDNSYTLGVKENQENDMYCAGDFGDYVCPRIVKEAYHLKNRAGNCTRLKQLLQYSPVGIYMYAEDDGFLQYSSGVFSSKTLQGTTDTSTDHAVIAVGYTVLNGVEVFIIQNSWGRHGEKMDTFM